MRTREAIVLAGGLGTRLRSALPDLPKALAPVCGRPFLAFVLDRLRAQRFDRVILATGYLHEVVESAIGKDWGGMPVEYSVEASPLGTGGAIALAAGRLRGASAHVLNGDTHVSFDAGSLEDAVAAAGAPMGMVLAAVPDVRRYGAVRVAGALAAGFEEKGGSGPGLVNAGSYLLTTRALESLPAAQRFSFETDVLEPETRKGHVAVFRGGADFIDIGIPEDLARARELFAATR